MAQLSTKDINKYKKQITTISNADQKNTLQEEIDEQLNKQSSYKKSVTAQPKKEKTRFEKVVKVASIVMILITIGPIIYVSFHSAGLF